ncbi:HK97 family phage prohead protease [Polycladomyces sp. WAk]|uniref:HK97 family phage prohead protease n=1 Tax=Polycladomyces zharkentensis TaxID=2807616 RepID=A0ABS2WMS4_9BACL|nr:HK97 family phage prohead protease [Polycladomyces sp. WAk]MBN2910778.1 HK97 family phage prohead protease [Polycladomyces sp. WAk]
MNPRTSQNEIRTLPIHGLETREQTEKSLKITGYAAVYDEFTEIRDWFGDVFYERIAKDAIKQSLESGRDIFALRNHSWDNVIGRTGQNLTLRSDEKGLFFELTPPNTTLGRDVIEEVRSGLINQCSIGFRIVDQDWEERDGRWFRTINELELYEITLTPIPAYTSTSAEVRSLTPDMVKKGEKTPEISASEQEERQKILVEANRVYEFLKKQGGYY